MELSLFSVSYAGLWGQHRLDLPAFIAKAAELGYSSVMLMGKRPHLSPLDTDDAALATIARLPGATSVKCAARGGRLHRFFAAARRPKFPSSKCKSTTSALCAGWPRRSMRPWCACSRRMSTRRRRRPRPGTWWSRACANAPIARPTTASRWPCRIITTWPCTPTRCWNCSPTSTGRT